MFLKTGPLSFEQKQANGTKLLKQSADQTLGAGSGALSKSI